MTVNPQLLPALPPGAEAPVLATRLQEGGEAWLVQVTHDPRGELQGRRLIRWEHPQDPTRRGGVGTLDGGHLDQQVEELLDRLQKGDGQPGNRPAPRQGVHSLPASPLVETTFPAEAGGLEVYVEYFPATPRLLVVGAGHISRPLARMGHLLGYRVEILDDRAEYLAPDHFPHAERLVQVDFSDPFRDVSLGSAAHLILVTRGHKYDYECLRRALLDPRPPSYIGMIGSRRRVRATYVQLEREGISRELIASIRAPIGLDLGAETPEEISVAIAAELVLLNRGGTGAPLRDQERVAERFLEGQG